MVSPKWCGASSRLVEHIGDLKIMTEEADIGDVDEGS